jgi:hypothetical protein
MIAIAEIPVKVLSLIFRYVKEVKSASDDVVWLQGETANM